MIHMVSACATNSYHAAEKEITKQPVQVVIDTSMVDLKVFADKANQDIPSVITISKERLSSDRLENKGAYYPLTFKYQGKSTNRREQSEVTVRIGARFSNTNNLLERSPQDGIIDLEQNFWEVFSRSDQGKKAEALHRRNVNTFETQIISGQVWERHLSEGILDKTYDFYRLPVSNDIYLNVLFIFDRQMWNKDADFRNYLIDIANEILTSVEVSR